MVSMNECLALSQNNNVQNKIAHDRILQYTTPHLTRNAWHSFMLTIIWKGENMVTATWRTPGIFKADAQKVCNELMEIGEEFTPEEIVESAKDETKELHKCFEWDDTKAADKYRLYQARVLTSQLVFKREVTENESQPVPTRVFNKTDSSGGYKIPERTFKVQSEYEALLQRAWAELRAFKLKYL